MFPKYKLKDFNFILFLAVIVMMSIGVIIISTVEESLKQKQTLGMIIAIVIMLVLSFIDYHFISKFYVFIYGINAVLLILVLIAGKEVNNAQRWFAITDSITIQPSEFSKAFLIIFFGTLLYQYKEREKINSLQCIVTFFGALAIPLFLIYKEPDLSTTLCITMVIMVMLYASGLSYKIIGIALLVFIPLAGIFIWYIQLPNQKLLYNHQVTRIMSFLYPSQYQDASAQQIYSVMAIGAGQLHGKGLGDTGGISVREAHLVSEQQTDFIFSAVGEELGFIGSVIIIAILLLIVLQCIRIARRAKDTLGSYIATGVGCLIAFQTFINIGVATSLLPNTGIPLPFVSYGLSSLISLAIMIGLVLNISMQKTIYD